jgi:hypothetical protein
VKRRPLRIVVTLLALALAFVVGIAVGEALHDNPASGGTQTIVRTLEPLPLAPAAERTVTVTTTAP